MKLGMKIWRSCICSIWRGLNLKLYNQHNPEKQSQRRDAEYAELRKKNLCVTLRPLLLGVEK